MFLPTLLFETDSLRLHHCQAYHDGASIEQQRDEFSACSEEGGMTSMAKASLLCIIVCCIPVMNLVGLLSRDLGTRRFSTVGVGLDPSPG